MPANRIAPYVPMSRLLIVGQRDSHFAMQDMEWTAGGTVDLKSLADKVLSRDSQWDSCRTAVKSTVPNNKMSMGQLQIRKRAADSHELFEERAAIMEFDGGLSRTEAESAARQELDIT